MDYKYLWEKLKIELNKMEDNCYFMSSLSEGLDRGIIYQNILSLMKNMENEDKTLTNLVKEKPLSATFKDKTLMGQCVFVENDKCFIRVKGCYDIDTALIIERDVDKVLSSGCNKVVFDFRETTSGHLTPLLRQLIKLKRKVNVKRIDRLSGGKEVNLFSDTGGSDGLLAAVEELIEIIIRN